MSAAPIPVSFACPRCDATPLAVTDSGFGCSGCKTAFPRLGNVPWLFADPAAALGEWRSRWHFLLRTLERRERGLCDAGADARPGSLTARRLTTLARATRAHRDELADLLEPLALTELDTERSTYLALRTRLPPDQGLTTYYGNVHRDWCWGEQENEAAIGIVRGALGDRPAGRTLVLGAGAGRLAYDWHRFADADTTVMLDFNPLLVFAAERIGRGETLRLHEFPTAPLDIEHQAVLRALAAPEPARAGLEFCLADAHRPPFPPKSFDTIVTPWLIDILPEPLDEQARRINRLLADDGRWINFGSLSFDGADPAARLSAEECLDALADAGFDDIAARDAAIPYMSSPASRHARTETVLSWSARKHHDTGRLARHQALPEWLVRGRDPVPRLHHFRDQATATRIHAYILSLIDGRRSIADMAATLEQQRLMSRADAEPAIRQFMMTLYEDSLRDRRY
jgi:hypothetical protein